MKVLIIYHSGYGHTKQVAEHICKGVFTQLKAVRAISVLEAMDDFDLLHRADTLVFGTPTYMGTVSADFKKFMEATGRFWYAQKWKNKLAAGFTNSSTVNGDKLNTLQQLALFAAQHSMLWIPTGILPVFENDRQLDAPNGMAGYLGLMTLSDNSTKTVCVPRGLETAELFGRQIAQITLQLKP
jgi:multimeric flavodoxin WrbA